MADNTWKKWQEDKNFIIDNDNIKEKSFLFSSFPTANKYGFQTGKIRPVLYGDVLARFERMLNKNVLYPVGFNTLAETAFLESRKKDNVLNDSIPDMFYHQMLKLGIGVNEQKVMNMRHDEYLSNLQLDFIELYERGYIEYKNVIVYEDKSTKKVYDYMLRNDNCDAVPMKAFVLKCGSVIDEVIDDIGNLSLKEEIKKKLCDAFDGRDVMQVSLETSIGTLLDISLENAYQLGGITYILLNPDFMDIKDYSDPDEIANVEEYIKTRNALYAYSGNYCTNPLTGRKIPILISDLHHEAVHAGNPFFDEDDRLFAENEGFEIIPILDEDNNLIHSDFLNGMNRFEAENAIEHAFTESGLAKMKRSYFHREIVLSSADPFGALIPFLEDNGKLYSLKKFLPYSFSVQFRPHLSDLCDIPGNPVSGTINSLFTVGMAPILSMLYDEMGSNESIFSDLSKEEYQKWDEIKSMAVAEDSIYSGILMPIIFNDIIRREIPHTPKLIRNVIIIPDTYDKDHDSIKRSNNNMLDLDSLLEEYSPDAIRAYFMSQKTEEDFIYNEDQLKQFDVFVKRLMTLVLNPVYVRNNNLDYEFYQFENNCRIYLDENKVYEYTREIIEFSEKVVMSNNLTSEQLLAYLTVIYPLMPFFAEEAYSQLFNDKYSIANEGYPC